MKRPNTQPGTEAQTPGPRSVPADLRKAFAAAPQAAASWQDLTPIARHDFLRWIDSAKQAETRQRRIRIACENLAAGKRRPCCYAVVPMDFYRVLGTASNKPAKAQWSTLTPAERREIVDWIDAAAERSDRTERIAKACKRLANGKRSP